MKILYQILKARNMNWLEEDPILREALMRKSLHGKEIKSFQIRHSRSTKYFQAMNFVFVKGSKLNCRLF